MTKASGRIVSALLLVAGFIGAFIESGRREASGVPVPARGEFWRVVAGNGQTKKIVGRTRGVTVLPGERFVVDDVISPAIELESMELRVENTGNQSGYLRIHFKGDNKTTYRLLIVPGAETQVSLTSSAPGDRNRKLINSSYPGLLADATTPFDLRMQLVGGSFTVEIDEREVLRHDDAAFPLRRALVRADDVRLLAAHIAGERKAKKKRQVPGRFDKHEDLTEFAGRVRSSTERLGWMAAGVVALLLLVAGYLRHLCLGAPSARLLWGTTVDCLAIPGAVVALAPWIPAFVSSIALLFACSFALRLALRRLKPHLHESKPLGIGGGLRCVTWILLLGGATAWTSGGVRSDSLQGLIEEAERATRQLSEQPFELGAALQLDHSNAHTLPGPYRSFTAKALLTLAPKSLLELRLHAQSGGAFGMALFLSSDERWKSGFVHESLAKFAPLGERFGPVAAGQAIAIEVRVVGDDYEAFLDGQLVASASLREFPSGAVTILAARGNVDVTQLSVTPTLPEPPIRGAGGEARAAAGYSLALLALLGVLATLLLRVSLLRSLEAAAWMLLPLLICLQGWVESDGRASLEVMAVTWLAFVTLALPYSGLRRRHVGAVRTLLFVVLASSGGLVTLNASIGPPITQRGEAGSFWNAFDLERLDPGMSHLQHPYVRRMNGYLRDHSFRGRLFSPEPAPETTRILALGGSSTWGHGIQEASGQDYPTVLETLLNERNPGQRYEVINGAVSTLR